MSVRTIKQHRNYKRYNKKIKHQVSCTFCDLHAGDHQFLGETESFKIIRNIFPYSLWDDQSVSEHLMLVPKKHTDTLAHLSANEALEYVKLISDYESRGYNVWARAPQTTTKSIIHQHTHLIKPGQKNIRLMLYVSKPYVRIMRFKRKLRRR